MGLDAALGIADGGLNAINAALSLISQNIANASTPGYAVETITTQSLDAGGLPIGVVAGNPVLASNPALQQQVSSASGQSAGAAVTSEALAGIEPALGTVADGNDLGSQLTALQDGFSSLLNDPSSQPLQDAVVTQAGSLTQGINTLSATYGQARQTAQDNLVAEVSQLNGALAQIGALSNRIIALQSQSLGTADLENQRNAVAATISQLVSAHFTEQPNGDLQVLTVGGAQLPTRTPNPLSISAANVGPGVSYPGGGLSGITLGGTDITAQLKGGQIAANVTLRDKTLPAYQGELDEFSATLASRFDAQGLTLFTNAAGALPATGGPPVQSGYLGFASVITVNPQVAQNPSLVRDGTRSVAAGDPGGGSVFTPNPQQLSGFSDLINRVLDYALGPNAQQGTAQPQPATTGLGAAGNLSAPFTAPATLGDFATAITASQAADSAQAGSNATDTQAVQSALQNRLTGETGVSIDTELSEVIALQNAYAANAKIISTVQSLLNDVLEAIH